MSFKCPLCQTPLVHNFIYGSAWRCRGKECGQMVIIEDVDVLSRQEGLIHRFRLFSGTKSGLRVERIEEAGRTADEGVPQKIIGVLRSGTESEALLKILNEEANKAEYKCSPDYLDVTTFDDPNRPHRFLVDCLDSSCKGNRQQYIRLKNTPNLYGCQKCDRVIMIGPKPEPEVVTDE